MGHCPKFYEIGGQYVARYCIIAHRDSCGTLGICGSSAGLSATRIFFCPQTFHLPKNIRTFECCIVSTKPLFMTNKEIIDALTADVRRLMQQHTDAVEQLRSVLKTNAEQALRIRSLQEEAKANKEEIARLRLGAALEKSGGDKSAARAQVNRLLREVDKCIALISNEI